MNRSAPKPAPPSAPSRPSLHRFLLVTRLPLEHETAIFILVSLLDLVATAWLIQTGRFRESNRMAAAVLRVWGLQGLLVFKFSLVAMICVLVQVIARYRPAIARYLLLGATILAAAIVIGSVLLGFLAGAHGEL